RDYPSVLSFPTRRSSDLKGDRVLTGARQHLELLGLAAADRTRVGLNRAELEAHAREDARVGVVHRPIAFLERGFVHVEGVRILRSEEHTSELQSRENLVC